MFINAMIFKVIK